MRNNFLCLHDLENIWEAHRWKPLFFLVVYPQAQGNTVTPTVARSAITLIHKQHGVARSACANRGYRNCEPKWQSSCSKHADVVQSDRNSTGQNSSHTPIILPDKRVYIPRLFHTQRSSKIFLKVTQMTWHTIGQISFCLMQSVPSVGHSFGIKFKYVSGTNVFIRMQLAFSTLSHIWLFIAPQIVRAV